MREAKRVRDLIASAAGRRAFDLLIRNVRIADVYAMRFFEGCVGITGGRIAYVGPDEGGSADEVIDGEGASLLPGFVDAHMHIESSMLSPYDLSLLAARFGTVTMAADPHEITNVLGVPGAKALAVDGADSPVRILFMAPSTVPSAPGLEGSGCEIDERDVARMLADPAFHGLGEVMDFGAVAAGDRKMCAILEAARKSGRPVDGHASVLSGRGLEAFRAAGILTDHTVREAAKIREEISLGYYVQLQEMTLDRETVRVLNETAAFDRICLVTDDTPLPHLAEHGHLNRVYRKAVRLGLDPIRAVRYTTLNPALCLRLYDTGAIVPGMRADLQLAEDPADPVPRLVLSAGRVVWRDGDRIPFRGGKALAKQAGTVMRLPHPIREEDLRIPVPGDASRIRINAIRTDGRSSRTARELLTLPVRREADGRFADTTGYMKMAVFNRYGAGTHSVGVIAGEESFRGAVALTYGHDCHNLTGYGSDDKDLCLALKQVAKLGGGLCAVSDGSVLAAFPLPIAGLMSDRMPDEVLASLRTFTDAVRGMGLRHEDPMMFFTLMPLAVSPEIKLTDRGLVDVAARRLIPLIAEQEGDGIG